METATRTALPAIRAAMPNPPSEVELFSMMLSTAEALPEMVQRDGTAWGIAMYKQEVRTILQVLSGCADHPSTRR
jgi:hypothetical protein